MLLVQRYLTSLASFARFVGELSDERQPVMPRLLLRAGDRGTRDGGGHPLDRLAAQRASIDNLAASAQTIVDGLPDPLSVSTGSAASCGPIWRPPCCLGSPAEPNGTSQTVLRQPQLLAAIDALLETGADEFRAPRPECGDLVLDGPPDSTWWRTCAACRGPLPTARWR